MPARVASLEIQMTNDVGNNGRTFIDGVRIDHPRAVETDDGWFTLAVGFIQATALGLRACRIGYVPAAP